MLDTVQEIAIAIYQDTVRDLTTRANKAEQLANALTQELNHWEPKSLSNEDRERPLPYPDQPLAKIQLKR